jgi:hypothetical protein
LFFLAAVYRAKKLAIGSFNILGIKNSIPSIVIFGGYFLFQF